MAAKIIDGKQAEVLQMVERMKFKHKTVSQNIASMEVDLREHQ